MKFSILAFVLAFTGSAFAQPESVSLVCEATQGFAGGTKTGKVALQASTPGNGNPWKIEVSWQGEKQPIVTSGVSCGQNLPADAKCYDTRTEPGLPFSLVQDCGPSVDRGGVPHARYISSIILDTDHGYFNCESANGERMHIALSECQVVP